MPKGVKRGTKSREEIDEEEIIIPLQKIEFEGGLKWLKNSLDNEILTRNAASSEAHKDIPLDSSGEEASINKPEFVKFLEYLQFKPPNQDGFWAIPKELKKIELQHSSDLINYMLNSGAIFEAKDIDIINCKGCKNEFTNLLQHLNKSKTCPSSYSEQEMKDLKGFCKHSAKLQKREWYKQNKQKRSHQMASYYQANRKEILLKRKNHTN